MQRSRRARSRPAAWLALVACSFVGCGQSERPNLLLVSIDSLRADHLGAYGYARDTSPSIDRLAREGTLFEHALSTTSWTLPSHAALFTGLYDSGHGLVDNGQRLAERHHTLAERLADAGYETFGVYGGPYLHPAFGLAQGFEGYESCMGSTPDAQGIRREARRPRSASHSDVTGPCVEARVRDWLGARGDDERPWFLFLHLWDPHYDFLPPADYLERFDPDYEGAIDGRNFMHDGRIHAGMAPRDLEHLLARYDAEIRFTDDVLGRILSSLGAPEDRVVVVTADHGEEFFEHGAKGHQKTLFDEVVRIPLIVHAPGRLPAPEGGRRVAQQVRLIDVMPTLLSLAGVPAADGGDGRDLSPLLRGEALPPASALLELYADRRDLRALRTDDWKLIVDEQRQRFFDLQRDPAEARAVTAKDPRIPAALAALDAQRGASLGVAPAETGEIDARLRERLEALGYLPSRDESATP